MLITEPIHAKISPYLLDSDYLKTIYVAVPASLKKNFLETYESLGGDLVGFGVARDWTNDGAPTATTGVDDPASTTAGGLDRHKVRGSPVVPGSARVVLEDREGCLFIVTILKGQFEPGYVDGKHFTPGVSNCFEEEFGKCLRDKR